MPDGSLDVADCCEYHKALFFESWARMQADAARLRACGFVEPELGRIMMARVERGAYEMEPAAKELLVRALEEQFMTATIRVVSRAIDVAFDSCHFRVECRDDGAFDLAERLVGTSAVLNRISRVVSV